MAWPRIGDKPLSEPKLTWFTDTYIYVTLGGDKLNMVNFTYCQTSNARGTTSHNLNVSGVVLQLSFSNPLKPGVKSRVKMLLEQRRQAWPKRLLPTKVPCIRDLRVCIYHPSHVCDIWDIKAVWVNIITNDTKVTKWVCYNAGHPPQTWFKMKSCDNLFVRSIHNNQQIILKFCTEHGSVTTMLSVKFQMDFLYKTEDIDRQVFVRFQMDSLYCNVPWNVNNCGIYFVVSETQHTLSYHNHKHPTCQVYKSENSQSFTKTQLSLWNHHFTNNMSICPLKC